MQVDLSNQIHLSYYCAQQASAINGRINSTYPTASNPAAWVSYSCSANVTLEPHQIKSQQHAAVPPRPAQPVYAKHCCYQGKRLPVMPPVRPLLILRFLFHFLPWLLHLSVANTLLSLLLPVSLLSPTAAYNASSLIAASVWRHIQHIFTRVNDADILITGDTLPAGESAIVVSNHVEWSDFYLIQALALRAGMLGRCRWFAKKELKWVPFLGWGLWAMGMPLVSRRWMDDKREMDRVFDGVVERKWPICTYNPIPYNPSHPAVPSNQNA